MLTNTCPPQHDTTADDCRSQFLALLGADPLGEDEVLYSLIDGAKFAGLSRLPMAAAGVTLHSLLGESAQFDSVYAGPVLLRHSQGAACPVLYRLLAVEDSAGFASLLSATRPLPELLRHLSWLTDVRHEDGTEWVMRYYDPLILPHWLAVLDARQRAAALSGLSRWLYIDVRGEAQAIAGTAGDSPLPPAHDPMLMTEVQSAALMQRAMPYLVMDLLESDDPLALATLPRDRRYDFFSDHLGRAHAHGLASATDLKTYCMLALMFGASFEAQPIVAQALAPAAATTFSEQILQWTPEQWALLEDAAAATV